MKIERNFTIDIMRSVCMVFIIMAHVTPPTLLHTLRSFDVVGLVMISAMCMKPYNSYKQYIQSMIKRLRRLVFPTYVFIVSVLISVFFLCLFLHTPYVYDKSDIISSFLLIDGIGYVWIIRVLIINAFLSPFIFKLASIKPIYIYLGGLIILLISKVIYMAFPYEGSLGDFLLKYICLYTLGYFVIALYAIVIKRNNFKDIMIHTLCLIPLLLLYKYVCHTVYGEDLVVLEKHPPMLDWIVYGIIVTDTLLYLTINHSQSVQRNRTFNNIVTWFSKNSFQVYFIHAWILIIYKTFIGIRGDIFNISWWLLFVIVFSLSVFVKLIYDKALVLFHLKNNG